MPKPEPKDPETRSKPASAFIRFTKVARQQIKDENPSASFGEMGKLLGSKWKALSPEERKVYTDEYQKEMEECKLFVKETGFKPKPKKGKRKKEAVESEQFNHAIDANNPHDVHQQPWPMNMYPHLIGQNIPQQMPLPNNMWPNTVWPTSPPVPVALAHAPTSQTTDANPNNDGNIPTTDSKSNWMESSVYASSAFSGAQSQSVPVPYVIPTGIYTSRYYSEVNSENTASANTPAAEPEVETVE